MFEGAAASRQSMAATPRGILHVHQAICLFKCTHFGHLQAWQVLLTTYATVCSGFLTIAPTFIDCAILHITTDTSCTPVIRLTVQSDKPALACVAHTALVTTSSSCCKRECFSELVRANSFSARIRLSFWCLTVHFAHSSLSVCQAGSCLGTHTSWGFSNNC